MALLNVVFSNCPSSFSPFSYENKAGNKFVFSPSTYANKENNVVLGKLRAPSLRKRSHLVKCSNRGLIQTLPAYVVSENKLDVVKRSDFPKDFVFGAGTAAYQIEGAYKDDGKGLSIWDTFTYEHPEKIKDGSNGEIALDSYHRYPEDIQVLKEMGVRTYRFSISWTRILPKGNLEGGTNEPGIEHYNRFIDELIANGIEPFVTLFHFDSPHFLQERDGGFLSEKIVDDFKDYCDLCFKRFGDRVKNWTTLNEPLIYATLGFELGRHAPGRCTPSKGCAAGDSAREPYIVGHNLILAHAKAARHYKENYQASQRGQIGIVLLCHWYMPYSDSTDDQEAAARALDFSTGWFMGPLVNGDYPFIMRVTVRERLPSFTDEEKEMVKGSADFIGINYYTARYAKALPVTNGEPTSYTDDTFLESLTVNKDGVSIGELAHQSSWIRICPKGLKDLLVYLKEKYNGPTLYVTENGVSGSSPIPLIYPKPDENDNFRIEFIRQHLLQIKEAIMEGVNVKGYFIWSLLDNMEWADGYTVNFGLYSFDCTTLKRERKESAKWFTKFLNGRVY